MALHLVGETIDARRAHLRAQADELVHLVRGVYVDAADDVETTILGHAVRIAHYLYPTAYLSSASAVLLRPTPDGRLFISGRRNQRTRLRALEIIQNEAPGHPSTMTAIVGDDMGELHVDASSPRQRFLEAFRLRSEHAIAITETLRAQMAARLIEEHGSPQLAADAVWALARENGWYREGEGAERYLLGRPAGDKVPANKAALDLLEYGREDIAGLSLASLLPPDQLAALLKRTGLKPSTEKSITEMPVLLREIEEIKRTAIAFDDGEFNLEVRCIAVPVKNFTGKAIGALGISGPVWRLANQAVKSRAKIVQEAAARLSAEFGAGK